MTRYAQRCLRLLRWQQCQGERPLVRPCKTVDKSHPSVDGTIPILSFRSSSVVEQLQAHYGLDYSVVDHTRVEMIFRRDRVLTDAFRHCSKPTFRPEKAIRVRTCMVFKHRCPNNYRINDCLVLVMYVFVYR